MTPLPFRFQERVRIRRRRTIARLLLGDHPGRLGEPGAFSSAFKAGGRVVRITENRDRAALWFAEYARRHSKQHWPRIFGVKRLRRHTAFWMERLYPLSPAGDRAVQAADDLIINGKHHSWEQLRDFIQYADRDEPWMHCPPRLGPALLALHAMADTKTHGR